MIDRAALSRRGFCFSAAALLGASGTGRAQEPPTFSTNVKVISVLANVRDKHGAIIRDLTKNDFALLEDGRPQTISYFTRQSDLPLTLGLLIDTSMSQERVLDAERSASFRFLDQILRDNKDHVFIVQFDVAVMTRQELTSSYKDLNDALASVNTPTRNEAISGGERGTLLYDAVVAESKDVMQAQHGRKALIVLTDGDDNGSDATLADSIDAAQRADTLVYSIYFSDSGFGGRDGRGVLERLSRETGGGFFEVSKKRSIDQIYGVIQDELRSQYSLGYMSDRPVRIPEFRKIQLKANDKGLMVQARERYWAQP
ncbi:MAG TPA: VWA domain-containing protein [Bryobacteraceae bacterium]|jgi:VWFA-related protein